VRWNQNTRPILVDRARYRRDSDEVLSRRRVVLIVLLGAGLTSAFSTAVAYQAELSYGHGAPIVARLAWLNGVFWYGWVVLAFPLVALSRRLRLDRVSRKWILVYVAAAVVAAFLHVALQTWAQTMAYWHWTLVRSADPDALEAFSWSAHWLKSFPMQLNIIDWELVSGAAIIGIAHAAFYYTESHQRAMHEAQLETRLVESQLLMLQHQLHPHFLFNTLHAISTLMHRDVKTADRVLVELSDLLRITLDSIARPEIRLSEEVEFLEKYLHIEQVRLGDRLTVEFDVDVDVLDAAVPVLILQPLVENAIKHGIAPLVTPGHVKVSARRQGDMLIMTVEDSGPGPSERAMAALSTGIGVSNTRARLNHQFGSRYRFEFQRQVGGFTVVVGLPFRQDPHVASIAAFVA
jgi:two-component system, LytTR family, sensor kinase